MPVSFVQGILYAKISQPKNCIVDKNLILEDFQQYAGLQSAF